MKEGVEQGHREVESVDRMQGSGIGVVQEEEGC
jgi:hypothetical protein